MNSKEFWLDNLRAIACIMVVILHVSAIYVQKTSGLYWEIGNLFDSFTRVCVPLFFMISGYLFLNNKQVKIKNFIRLSVPLIFYSIISLIFLIICYEFGFLSSVKFSFFSQPIFYHLWYFYPILIIYFISYYSNIRLVNFSIIQVLTFLTLIFVFCNPKVNDIIKIFTDFKFENYFFIHGEFVFYLFYALVGGMIKNLAVSVTQGRIFLLVYFLSSVLIIIFSSYTKSLVFYEFSSPLVCLSAVSFFIYFKSKGFSTDKQNKALSLISKYSLGIYCIHAIILLCVEKIFVIKNINPFIGVFVFTLLVLILSIMYSFLLRKVDKNGYIS